MDFCKPILGIMKTNLGHSKKTVFSISLKVWLAKVHPRKQTHRVLMAIISHE